MAAAQMPDARPTVHPINLLLVDDQPSNLLALEAVLCDRGYNLILAHSGFEAIDLMKKHEIALVLLDVQMPEMDGFETARRLKAIEGRQNVPIIFITAIYKEEPWIKKGYEVGGVDYFSKPFDPDILRMKVGLYSSFHEKMYLLQEREKRIRETEEILKAGQKLSDVLETLPVGVLVADAEGRVCQVNEQVLKIWGCTGLAEQDRYGDFLGWWDHDGKLIKASHGPMARSLMGESTHNELTQIKCFDGTSRYVLSSASPLRKLGGEIAGVVVVIQDVTEHKQIERELEQRIQQLMSSEIKGRQETRD
ncbi:MAG TPA: response regulator [Nitrospira sp.]|nr:response regulator [Nitrospira sp.]